MSGPDPRLTVRELTPETWKDFEGLFARYGGVQSGCWCMFYHRDRPVGGLPDAKRIETNRLDHRRLVESGHAHGVLVYRGAAAVGWCQFGPRADLPRLEHGRKYRALELPRTKAPLWRITCFFVDRPERRRGVAKTALRGALEAIARAGGGVVEAYPSTNPRAVATWFGSRGMFEHEGFRVVAPFGQSHLLMRRTLSPGGGRGSRARRPAAHRAPRRAP